MLSDALVTCLYLDYKYFFKMETPLLSISSFPLRNNYKEYSMESRTQFRIHAALSKLKADVSDQDEITAL